MSDVDQKNKTKKLSELAIRIRNARREARLSQQALGDSIGVSDKSVSAYEQGRSVPPFDKLKKIAVNTNRPVSYFTEDNIDAATITTKLLSIERELAEVKKLLKAAKK
jgi:transcriptional regulator with XRE-family HTH domain